MVVGAVWLTDLVPPLVYGDGKMTERLAALKAKDPIEFWGNKMPKCPHCGTDIDIDQQEWWHLYEEDTHGVECPICDLPFEVRVIASYSFSTDEQDDPSQ